MNDFCSLCSRLAREDDPMRIGQLAGGMQQADRQSWQPRPMVPFTPNPQPTPAVQAELTHPQPMGNW